MKRFLWSFSGILAAILMLVVSSSPAHAIDNILDVQTWTFSKANIIKNNNVQSSCTSNVNYFTCAVSPSAGNWFNIAGFDLTPSKTIPADSYVVFNIEIHPPTNGYYSEFHYNGFVSNNSSEYVIVDQKVQPVEASRNNVSIQITLYTSKPSNWLSLRPTNGNGMAIQADLASGGNMNIIISPAEVITVVSGKLTNEVYQTILGAIKNGEFNVKTDNSDVVDSVDKVDQTLKDQQQKEEEQRKEDEQKAQDSGDQAQNSADDSQAGVDEASASLFSVINGVKDSILQGSDNGNCKISADFGFFNAGTIDLCTGGAKIKPITSIVGDIMLIFFTFTSAVGLILKFIDLYNEYMGYR